MQGEKDKGSLETFSAFVAKVLDQLSLSSWFASAILVSGAVLLLQLRFEYSHGKRLADSLFAIEHYPPRTFLMILGTLVIANIFIQSFTFEMIRIFEGYWGATHIGNLLRRTTSKFHAWRYENLRRRGARVSNKSLDIATHKLFRGGEPLAIVEYIRWSNIDKTDGSQRPQEPILDPEQATRANELNEKWRSLVPKHLRLYEQALLMALSSYPKGVIMPTKLGNVLRSYEEQQDKLIPGEHVVQKLFHQIPEYLQHEHDQQRVRLDLYASLTFVGIVLAIAYEIVLRKVPGDGGIRWSAGFLVFSYASYRAAIATAHAYGTLLKVIAEWLCEQGLATPKT
jgi:hypothetical protein